MTESVSRGRASGSATDPVADAVRWAGMVCAELGLCGEDLERLSSSVLNLVRAVAHGVNRPSAPLTAFLVGLAAGRAAAASDTGIDAEVLLRLEQVRRLIESWESHE